jgi:hypothetical protein
MRATLACAVVLGLLAVPVGADEPTAVSKERLRASVVKLRLIAHAFHGGHDETGYLPGEIFAKDGKPLLSWRVAILPYLDEMELYKQFKLDEPWDSENNLKLVAKMPKIYAPVRGKAQPGETFYQTFYGAKTLFDPKAKKRPTLDQISIASGTSNTVMVIEAGVPTVWTKPHDLPFDEKKPLPKLGGQFDGDFHILFCDGAVRLLKKTTKEGLLKHAIDPASSEPYNLSESVIPPGR